MRSARASTNARDADGELSRRAAYIKYEQVADIQRARMIIAAGAIAAEHGAADLTVAQVIARAGVSRRTFYEVFEDREDCLLAAVQDALARATRYVLDSYDPRARWLERMRVGVSALLRFLDAEPELGRLLIVSSLETGARGLACRREVLERLAAAVDEGRAGAGAGSELSPLTAEGIVGGALSVVHLRMLGEKRGSLVDLAGPLTSMIVLPYLGRAAARRELDRPVAQSRTRPRRTNRGDPLRELEMRLTYRTIAALAAIAADPGASNRAIGLAAGIADPGQVSKLLARLERRGLVRNAEPAPGRGGSNAWEMTAKGRELERVMGIDTARQSAAG